MRRWLLHLSLIPAVAALALAADPAIEKLFTDARAKVLRNTANVPRYMCVQTVTRTQYPARTSGRQPSCQDLIAARHRLGVPGNITMRDRLRLDVAVVDGKEMFSWAGAGHFETDALEKLVPGGVSGSGSFIGFMASVFGGGPETVRFTGLANDQAQFEYTVPLARSHYEYRAEGAVMKTTGFTGTFALDPDSAELTRLVVDTDPFPAGEPLCQVEDSMDYQRVKIGSGDFLLPEVAIMDVVYRSGDEARNETHYSQCREFTGESNIRFDDVDPNSVAAPASASGALAPIPSKLRFRIGFTQNIDGDTAAAGDPVTGVLLEDVQDKAHRVVAHRNDKVYGRILRLEQHVLPAARWIVQIRFDHLDRGGIRQPIDLTLPGGQDFLTFPEHGDLTIDRTYHADWESR